MTTTASMKLNRKEVGNINMPGRTKQFLAMVVAIIIGMIISATTVDAKDFQRENQKKYKATYKKQTTVMANACHILKVKRTVSSNKVVKETNKLKFR
jgi:hypothetical protein